MVLLDPLEQKEIKVRKDWELKVRKASKLLRLSLRSEVRLRRLRIYRQLATLLVMSTRHLTTTSCTHGTEPAGFPSLKPLA